MSKETTIAFIAIVAIVLAVTGLIVLLAGFDTVDANHLGVKVRLGKIMGVQEPGMQWTGLFTEVHQYDLRVRKNVIDMSGANSAVDKTGQAIFSTININYRVKPTHENMVKLYSRVGNNDVIADRTNIEAIVAEGFKQATVKYEALEILDKRQEVKDLAKENIRNNFPEYFEITDIVVTNIDFSENFKAAIEAKKTAEQDAIKEQNQLKVVIAQQQQEIEKSKALAEKIRLEAAQLTDYTIRKAWIDRWSGELPQYLITTEENANTILSLPGGR